MPIDFQLPADPPAQVQPPSAPSFDDQYAQARALANGGQPELALAAYSALLTRSPGNADVLLGRGLVYARLGRWSEQPAKALGAYEHLVMLRPNDAAALVARARAQRALGHAFEARADLEQARTLGGDAAEIGGLLADLQPAVLSRAAVPSAGNPDATSAAGYSWAASLSSGWTDVGNGPRWNDQTASVRRYMQAGSLGFETLRAQRFGQHDYAWALDGYASLWRGAYANLRYQHSASSRLFPANSGRIEVWQALGKGWEGSLSEDVLGFDSRVNIHGLSIARYAGNFYVQLRHQNIVSQDSHSTGDRLLARWYYLGDADNYLELSANSGRSDDPLSLVGGRARSGGGGVAWVRYFTPQWGGKIAASFSRAAAGGGASGNERGITFALYRRW
jgi:YaiO family outer membrane protein